MRMSMSALQLGQRAVLEELGGHPVLERLRHMGFYDGAQVELVHVNCGGTLLAFIIDRSIIALRAEDCRQIEVALQ